MLNKKFILSKIVILIFAVVCLGSLTFGTVFAYVSSIKLSLNCSQTLQSCTLVHNSKILFSTISAVDASVGSTYFVQPISADTVQVKCAYSVIKTNNTFSITSGDAEITDVWVYGINLVNGTNTFYTLTNNNLTITFESIVTNVIDDADEVILTFQFS